MRWRPGPRLAFALGLLCVTVAGMRFLRPETSTLAAGDPTSSTIDSTLGRDLSGCAGARSTVWNPLAGVEYTGRVRIDLPARYGGAIVLFIGDTVPLDVETETLGGDPVQMHQQRLPPGPGLHIPPDFWLDDENPWRAPGHIIRATVDARPDRDLSFVVSLGRRAPRVLARLIGYPADVRVPVCAVPLGDGEPYFATGWYGGPSAEDAEDAEKESAEDAENEEQTIRWMRDVGAVLVSSVHGGATMVRVRATAATTAAGDPTQLTLTVNDVLEMPPLPMREGAADYEWHVPDAAWVAGTNELLFRVSRTETRGSRVFGMALGELSLLRRE